MSVFSALQFLIGSWLQKF